MSALFGVPAPEEAPLVAPRKVRPVVALVAVVICLGLLGLIIYTGATGLKGRNRPEAEGFDDATKPVYNPVEYARVVEVFDGDTVKLEDGRHVRYLGIDTPETAKPHLGVEVGDPFADEAEELNRQLVLGREVGLIYGIERTDHYGRTLACLIISDPDTGEDICVNAELLRRGLARAYIVNRHFRYRKWFLKNQAIAQNGHLGLWRRFGE